MPKTTHFEQLVIRLMAVLLLTIVLHHRSALAQDVIGYDQWVLARTAKSTEAFTPSGNDTSLGVYCAGDQCLFYLKMPLACQPGSQSTALLNNGLSTKAFAIQCMPVKGQFFQVLTPFDEVLATIISGQQIGVVVPVQSSGFAVSRFETRGAKEAIERAIQEATIRVQQNTTITPQIPNVNQKSKSIQL